MKKKRVVVIGGSAGCYPALVTILKGLDNLSIPVLIVLHRAKNIVSEMDRLLSLYTKNKMVVEPVDKEVMRPNGIYLAPQNYHLLVEHDLTFSLDYSEAVQYSRPSIDVTFECIADVFADGVTAIVLSGTNADGTKGLKKIIANGGEGIVQDPKTADYSFMPQIAIDQNPGVKILTPEEINIYLQQKR